MNRLFRHTSEHYIALANNQKHAFAQNYALNIYNSDAVYSFIPKNACSTLRTSIAFSNGCISDRSDFNWIHSNNQTFKSSLSDLAKAKYTFVILRCPFSRLASAYLDKIVEREPIAWNYRDLLKRQVNIDSISFYNFVRSMRRPPVLNGNPHWKPQKDFLIYKEYDEYFSLESFQTAVSTLKDKINLDIIDSRELTKHGVDGYKSVDNEDFSKVKPLDILNMKGSGLIPSYKSLYSDELIDIVKNVFSEDIDLYRDVIGDRALLFC